MLRDRFKNIILSFIILSGLFFGWSSIYAATSNISVSETSVSSGDTFTVTISGNAASWKVNLDYDGPIKPNGSTRFSDVSSTGENENVTIGTVTFTATGEGKANFSLSGQLVDGNYNETSANGSASITIKDNEPEPKQDPVPEPEPKQDPVPEPEPQKNTETVKEEQKQEEKEPEPTITEINKKLYGAEDGVNIRSSYSASSNAVGTLEKGQELQATGITSNGWTRIKYNGKTAYIKSDFLTETKPKSSNNALKSLKLNETKIDPEFSTDVLEYKATVSKDVDSVKVEVLAEDENAKVDISGNEKLQTGENIIKIVVTAEDGSEKKYEITITKESKDKLQLKSLEISGITLTEKFSPDKYEYNLKLTDKTDVKKLDIKAKANQEDATVEILGNEGFKTGENVITIMVKSKDEKETVTYQIIVNKPEIKTSDKKVVNTIQNSNDTFLYVAIGIFVTALFLIIIIIVRSIRKSKKDDYDDLDEEENNINYTEELYGLKQKDNKNNINENNYIKDYNDDNINLENKQSTPLYDVEKEVDFSDVEEEKPKRKGGKHSK